MKENRGQVYGDGTIYFSNETRPTVSHLPDPSKEADAQVTAANTALAEAQQDYDDAEARYNEAVKRQAEALSKVTDALKNTLPDDHANLVEFHAQSMLAHKDAMLLASHMRTTANNLVTSANTLKRHMANDPEAKALKRAWDRSLYEKVSANFQGNAEDVLSMMSQFAGAKARYEANKVIAHNLRQAAEKADELFFATTNPGLANVQEVKNKQQAYDSATPAQKQTKLNELNTAKRNVFSSTPTAFEKYRHLPDPHKMVHPDKFD